MEFFGDESGHLRSLLGGACELFVLAVVGGDLMACSRCPKRAVRNASDLAEAKWSDMTDVQKRRMVDCLRDSDLSFCYVAIRESDLRDLDDHYLLFQDRLHLDWDLAVMADAYAEMLAHLAPNSSSCYPFTFDQMIGKRQSDEVADAITERLPAFDVDHAGSRQVRGLQTADCFAGAVAESLRGESDWLAQLDDANVTCTTEYALISVEKRLHDVKTDP